ncbi:outer membrane assembly protein AsmA [Erwinia sp. BC051422]|uniref:outer membrane assembly protein AsmA n=1 Tax=Erwinia wuhanensis TaxID=3045167 RepID=UPI002652B53C|nr:outer membrane assembly protein AsmA [Erwinia sp. BC051422]MDN8542476.1 outer membrane assembly protein AsmA [Erwinia sp. BC051422]
MKRFITTLAILLVVIVAGMTALVLLVNPNDFRAYMARQVEQRSGYQLALNGDLRWHVWPQLSILSGPMTLTAPGAQQPFVSASNMRLDVKLLPLLSHQLAVKQVLLKGAVIRLTPDSAAQRPANAPQGPADTAPPPPLTQRWTFDIDNLQVADSLLIWQQNSGEQLNVRDLNLQLSQNAQRHAHIEFGSRVSRDQRELLVNLNADVDLSHYPQHLAATVNQLDYQLSGADLPREGVKGQATLQAEWRDSDAFSLKNLALSLNDSQLNGSASGTLGDRPQISLDLHASVLNLDPLLGLETEVNSEGQNIQTQRGGPAPVIAQPVQDNASSPFNQMDGQLALSADKLNWRGMTFDGVTLQGNSSNGLVTLATLTGKTGNGQFSLPGSLDFRHAQTQIALTPSLQNIAVAPLLKAFELPASLSGDLTLNGSFSGAGLSVPAFKHAWQGSAEISLNNALLSGLNFQRMIQRAVERSSNRVHAAAGPENDFQQITGKMSLQKGLLAFVDLHGRASMLNYSGKGTVNMADKQADMNFGVTVTEGWQGDSELIGRLQQTPVPLRIYGPWDGLNYSLQIDQVLRQQLQDEAKKRLKAWSEKNPQSGKSSSVQKLINDL